jgi:hypothetical protein
VRILGLLAIEAGSDASTDAGADAAVTPADILAKLVNCNQLTVRTTRPGLHRRRRTDAEHRRGIRRHGDIARDRSGVVTKNEDHVEAVTIGQKRLVQMMQEN